MSDDSLFAQYSLFPPETPTGPAPERPVRPKARSYDAAVLRYVGYYRAVTLHQVITRFFLLAGHGPGYGFRLVRSLVRRGLIRVTPLDPGLGTVSRQICGLTPEGWAYLGLQEPPAPRRTSGADMTPYRLQFAEVMLVRESEGWVYTPEATAWSRVREWGLRSYHGRAINAQDRMAESRIQNMPPLRTGLNVLWHRKSREIRWILPVRRGKSIKRLVEPLPATLGLFPRSEFELVVADPELSAVAADLVRRWSERTRVPYRLHELPNFRTRLHPGHQDPTGEDVYATHEVPDPRILI